MKIAVTYENGEVFQHFGHTEQFKLYEVSGGKLLHTQVVDTNGSGHGALAGLLAQLGVDTLICGGIGGGAQAALAEANIRLMDLENLQQEQAAAQMGVARTTVQLIYNNARRKLADCLVNGKRLVIEGGDVALCERHAQCPGRGHCCRSGCPKHQK